MTLSRLVGLPLAVLVLHLSLVANESKCRPGTPSHAHHGARPPARSESAHHQPHAPAVPVCCQALGSCTATIGLTKAEQVAPGFATMPRHILTETLTRTSFSTAPEAPPPRA